MKDDKSALKAAQKTSASSSKDKQLLWDSHDCITAKTEALEGAMLKSVVNKAVKEVRGANKARRRS